MQLKKFLVKAISSTTYSLKFLLGLAGLWQDRKMPADGEIKNILIVCLGYIGDVVFCVPCIHALRRRYPSAKIIVWIKNKAYDVLSGNPHIDELLVYDGVSVDRTRQRQDSIMQLLEFAGRLRTKKIDLWIDLIGVFGSIFVGFFSKANFRLGFSSQGLGAFLDKEIPGWEGRHLKTKYAGILKGIGIDVDEKVDRIYTNKEDDQYIEKFLRLNGIRKDDYLICVHPGANWPTKQWPAEQFAALIDKLVEQYKAKVMVIGLPEEIRLMAGIKMGIKNSQTFFNSDLSLSRLKSLVKTSRLFIGHDSGPTYIAEALNIPIVAIFGPTNPVYSAPRSENSVVVYKKLACSAKDNMQHCHNLAAYPCESRKCMKKISVDDVLEAISGLLGPLNEKNQGISSYHRA